MSNKSQLQTNNTVLDSYIARIKAAKDVAASLPEAGNGGVENISTVYINITIPTPMDGNDGDIWIVRSPA